MMHMNEVAGRIYRLPGHCSTQARKVRTSDILVVSRNMEIFDKVKN